MNARQFTAPTAREAMALARKALGPDAVILNNRKTPQGICVTAMLESDLLGLGVDKHREVATADSGVEPRDYQPREAAGFAPAEPAEPVKPPPAAAPAEPAPVAQAPAAPMSTLSFERFANDRRSRRQAAPEPTTVEPRDAAPAAPRPEQFVAPTESLRADAFSPAQPERAAAPARPSWQTGVEPVVPASRIAQSAPPANVAAASHGGAGAETASELMAMAAELRQMRSFISQQFSALSWVDGVRRTPGQAQVLRRLLQAGFSSQLARSLVGHLPASLSGPPADQWLAQALVKNLAAPAWSDGIIDAGGVFALVGPTGVGKTTSVAKIAARCALDHGVDQVGLITADAYRVGAQDQLRRFGAMIGITVHTAHDSQSLHGLLSLLQDKRTVLIDTAGLGQRDERVSALLEAVSQGPIQRLLVLSAAAQIESMREAMEAYRGNDCAGVLLTKIDEACRLGGALDTLIRFRLPLLAVANGQRVPEDWQEARPEELVAKAFENIDSDEAGLPDIDLTMLMQRIDANPGSSGAPAMVQAVSAGGW